MRSSSVILVFVVVMSLTLISCTGQQSQQMEMAQVSEAINKVNAEFMDAFKNGDAAGVAALYTDDTTLMPPNSEIIKGREGVQNFWNGGMQMGIKEVTLTSVDVSGVGNLAYEIGNYSLKIQPEGQEATSDQGKYIVVWKKDMDGTWKLHADIWNTSMPQPGQEISAK